MRAAVSAMFLMNGFVVGSWAPLVPELANRHGLSESAVGLMILALGFGSLLVMPVSGALIARIGALPVLRVTCIIVSLALLPVVFAPGVPWLAAMLFLFGGGDRIDGHRHECQCGGRGASAETRHHVVMPWFLEPWRIGWCGIGRAC